MGDRLKMNLIKGENNLDCILAAAAMVMDIDLVELKKKIGHGGHEIIFPNSPEPYCRRGFHIQEIIDQAFQLNWSVMYIQRQFGLEPFIGDDPTFIIDVHDKRLVAYLTSFPGIIAGVNGNKNHAVAWDGKMIYDPSGRIYSLIEFNYDIQEFWAFSKLK